ncbi:Hypothetical predicted protein, partial [Mytilus galloprovincialis]
MSVLCRHVTCFHLVFASNFTDNLTPNGTASQSSSYQKPKGNAEYAIYPPASNKFTDWTCSQTVYMRENGKAWWMFRFSFGFAHITDITIYYREGFAKRMDGFQLYVTNTSNIPPHGYRCYTDPHPGLPEITQTIHCNQLGKYVIYYDEKGSDEGNFVPGPIVELCYVAINDNMASESLVSQYPNGSKLANKATDGYKTSCSRTQGLNVMFQVDLKKESIVTGIYITLGELTTNNGMHSVHASNTSTWTNGIELYNENVLPKEIHFNEVFRFLTYLPKIQGSSFDLELCEIGIIGCPPTHYGPLCNKMCPGTCYGPCDLETGLCIFGCSEGWTGDECEQACLEGTYGKDCRHVCSTNCLNPSCGR